MKKKLQTLVIVLGAIFSLSGCGCFWGCFDTYSDIPFGYVSGKVSKTGTRVTAASWTWYDLAVYQRGMVVEIYRGNSIIRRYDLRIPRQEICEYFDATNLYGEAINVRVDVNGRGRPNVLYCYCGPSEEHWFLTIN